MESMMTADKTGAENTALKEAILAIQSDGVDLIEPKTLVQLLAAAEKRRKRNRQSFTYGQLVGRWRLQFVSGTKAEAARSGKSRVKKLGDGRYIPSWVEVAIAYQPAEESTKAGAIPDGAGPYGEVTNSVTPVPLTIQLSGPTRYWLKTNSLGFDFTHAKAKLGTLPMYNGGLRGGEKRNQLFQVQGLKDQAFFTFFWVTESAIAARGRGGGLALWTAMSND